MIEELLKEYGVNGKDESGLYVSECMSQECLLAELLPKVAKIKTDTDKNYNELVVQCRQAVVSYPDSELICIHYGCIDAPTMPPFNGNPRHLFEKVVHPERIRILAPGERYRLI